MYRLKVKDSVFTIPKENIGLLAFTKAQDMDVVIDPNDKEMAIRFLEGIGIKVESIDKETDLIEIPKVHQWNNIQHRNLYNRLFYQDIGRELTDEENEFCTTMYHFEEYACGLDG